MAFTISRNQTSFSDEVEDKTSINKDVNDHLGSVTSHLFLKTPPQSLDKTVVLRRLRHHKAMSKVKNTLQAFIAPETANIDDLYEKKWLQLGDNFTSP